MHALPSRSASSTRVARALVLGAALALLVLGGCGGGSSGGGDDDDPPFDPPAGPDIRLNTDPAGSELSVFPEIATDAHRVYAVWYDRRSAENTDIYFNRSLDGGASWRQVDERLDTDPAGEAGSNVPRIACAGDRVYVAWEDQRGPGSQIRFNRSLDSGTSWLDDDVRLDRDQIDAGSSRSVSIACIQTTVHVVWQDTRNGQPDVYYNRSLDSGTSWLNEDVRLDTDPAGTGTSIDPVIVCSGQTVLVAWQEHRSGKAEIYLVRSADGGVNWPADDERLDRDDGGIAGSTGPRVACEGSLACVVWSDDRDGDRDVYANASMDGGAHWLPDDVRVDTDAAGVADSTQPRVALVAGRAFVVWEDDRHPTPSVYFSRSEDGGASWSLVDQRLDVNAPGRSSSLAPDLAVTLSHVHVVWADDRNGAFDVLLRTSADTGVTWSDREVRMDTDEAGAAASLFPRVAAMGAEARVVWADQRHGPGDVYANRAAATGP